MDPTAYSWRTLLIVTLALIFSGACATDPPLEQPSRDADSEQTDQFEDDGPRADTSEDTSAAADAAPIDAANTEDAADGATHDTAHASCELDEALCDGACLNITENPEHCGACGRSCANGEFCSDRQCVRICGGQQGDTCEADEFCKLSRKAACGALDMPGYCAPRPSLCDEEEEDEQVCGCDGQSYDNECLANRAGTSVRKLGRCTDPSEVPGECDAQDAEVTGACRDVLGYYWGGTSCWKARGCRCEGEDCNEGYSTEDECIEDHALCRVSQTD